MTTIEVFNNFNISALKEIFWKTKTFFKKLEYRFLIENTKTENALLPSQKPVSREIEWSVQNGPITKNGVLPVTTLFFQDFCLNLRISYKELI